MTDQRLKDAFLLGAGAASPSPDLWRRVEAEAGRRTAARRLQRRNLVAAAAAALLFFSSLLALSPGARAAVAGAAGQVVTLWQARFGETPVQVDWENRTPAPEEYYTFTEFADVAALAGYVGFDPVLSDLPGATPAGFKGHRGLESSGQDVRVARVEYTVDLNQYRVETTGWYTPQGERLPQTELTLPLLTPEPPVRVWEEPLGTATAACMEWTQPGWHVAACTFLKDGLRISISGPEFRVVSRLATFIDQ